MYSRVVLTKHTCKRIVLNITRLHIEKGETASLLGMLHSKHNTLIPEMTGEWDRNNSPKGPHMHSLSLHKVVALIYRAADSNSRHAIWGAGAGAGAGAGLSS